MVNLLYMDPVGVIIQQYLKRTRLLSDSIRPACKNHGVRCSRYSLPRNHRGGRWLKLLQTTTWTSPSGRVPPNVLPPPSREPCTKIHRSDLLVRSLPQYSSPSNDLPLLRVKTMYDLAWPCTNPRSHQCDVFIFQLFRQGTKPPSILLNSPVFETSKSGLADSVHQP